MDVGVCRTVEFGIDSGFEGEKANGSWLGEIRLYNMLRNGQGAQRRAREGGAKEDGE
jgi:hypothetical protein